MPYILCAAVIAGAFAAVPFWTRGLPLKWAELASIVIFPSVLVFLVVATSRGDVQICCGRGWVRRLNFASAATTYVPVVQAL